MLNYKVIFLLVALTCVLTAGNQGHEGQLGHHHGRMVRSPDLASEPEAQPEAASEAQPQAASEAQSEATPEGQAGNVYVNVYL